MNILHVTVHLGGGVGKAIAGIAIQGQHDTDDCHRILLLQSPEKIGWVQRCQENGVSVVQWDGSQHIFEWADVLVVSWWNHPAMARFLARFSSCHAARVLWCHVNGVYYPVLSYQMAAAFDRVMFTSKYSMQNPFWTEEEKKIVQSRASLVYGMGQFRPEDIRAKEDYRIKDAFTVGYVGTLNFGKIHPDFVAYCRAACEKISNLRFVMIGDRDPNLEQAVHAAGLKDRFIFTGYVTDVFARMREFDVFGYLLNPTHYGTTENVLLEAMSCGLPVVALRQNVEQFIIPAEAGYLVQSPKEYAERLEQLYNDCDLRIRMGHQGRAHIIKTYHSSDNLATFSKACSLAICEHQNTCEFSFLGDTPWNWFLQCLPENDRSLFIQIAHGLTSHDIDLQKEAKQKLLHCPPIYREERKSSLRHFASTYPEDKVLKLLNSQLRGV